jgi:hypothetical protein
VTPPDDPATGSTTKLDFWRRLVAFALLGGLVAVVVWSNLTGHLRVCDDLVARVGSQPVVRSCRPLSTTDAPVIALFVFIGALFFPDLTSIKIAGVVELAREVKQQETRTESLERKFDILSVNMNAAASSAETHVHNYYDRTLGPGEQVHFDEQELRQKENRLKAAEESTGE